MDEQLRDRVAMFRYGVIGHLLSAELPYGELNKAITLLAQREYAIPGSTRRTIREGTVRDWLTRYRAGGYDALKPRSRSDIGSCRALDPHIAQTIMTTKQQSPKISVKTILKGLIDSGTILPRQCAPATVYRFLAAHLPKVAPSKTGKVVRRFAHRFPNDCWQGDVMHGPYIKTTDSPKARKTYLLAFIDDASRLIVAARFFLSETTANVKFLLRHAFLTYGIPRRLYLDNGPCYRADELRIACASINCALIHTTPYYPEGKGKIERYFRTVQSACLPTLGMVHSIDELNTRFDRWLQNDYNRAPHTGIDNAVPLDTFLKNADGHIRPFPASIDPVDLFCKRETRKVDRLATFRVDHAIYQTEQHLAGMTIDIRYDPDDPSRKVNVFHQGTFVGPAYPIDFNANAISKRPAL
jgi:transposase InsO family protein